MASLTIRTTVAFDPATVARWERLTQRWGTSKSETLRRALETAERVALPPPANGGSDTSTDDLISRMTPMEAFRRIQAQPPGAPGWGAAYRQQLRDQRAKDALVEEERESVRAEQRELAKSRRA